MDIFLARQPIFDRRQRSVAYELLFRAGPENLFRHSDGDHASRQVIRNSMAVFDLHALTGGRKAFINVTRALLVDEPEWIAMLPASQVVLEILETIRPEPAVLEACKKLKRAGYVLALDDFVFTPEYEPFLPLADIVKVDFVLARGQVLHETVERCRRHKMQLLAEKVETRADVNEALTQGFDFLQGFFFCKPEMLSRKEIPANKLNYLRFLQEVNRAGTDYEKLETIIRQEISLSVRLLRLINSSSFALQRKVDSIHWALNLLGLQALRRWASVLAIADLGSDKPSELVATTLVRARFCELLGDRLAVARGEGDLFLMGLLSTLDVLMDRPLSELLAELPVSDAIKAALLREEGLLGQVYRVVLASERGQWPQLERGLEELGLTADETAELHSASMRWGDQVVSGTV